MALIVFFPVRAALFPPAPALETVDLTPANRASNGPALCPWREPEADLRAFFPGATGYHTETLVFSSLRPQIMARLGPNVPLRETALRQYRVFRQTRPVGTVVVRAASGAHGAIEVVVAVAPDGSVVGVHLQRLREPPAIADALTAPSWLTAFRGKTANDAWQIGRDVPDVREEAQASAAAVAQTVRTLLIEQQVAAEAASAVAAKTTAGK